MANMVDTSSVPTLIVEALLAGLGDSLIAVLLFGSQARGSARPDSDWDVLVVADDLPARVLERHVLLKRLLPPAIRGRVSILARTSSEMTAAIPLPALYRDIALDARVLCDDRGFADRWIRAARQDIEAQGLRREASSVGLVWRFHPVAAGDRR